MPDIKQSHPIENIEKATLAMYQKIKLLTQAPVETNVIITSLAEVIVIGI